MKIEKYYLVHTHKNKNKSNVETKEQRKEILYEVQWRKLRVRKLCIQIFSRF